MAGSANAVSTWTGEGGDFLFSTAANWQDENVPSLEELNAEIAFPAAAAGQTITNDLGAIQVTKISFSASTAVTLDATPGSKFTELTTITTSSSVHNVFNCPVECKSGTTPSISNGSDNYIKFIGGLRAQALAYPTLKTASYYYMGKIEILNGGMMTGNLYANDGKSRDTLTTRFVLVEGSELYVPSAAFSWVKIESGAMACVSNLSVKLRFYSKNNSKKFMCNDGAWAARWSRVADECNGILRVIGKITIGEVDCFMPNMTSENSMLIVKGIEHAAVYGSKYNNNISGYPICWLNQGVKSVSSTAAGSSSATGPARLALGSGGLSITSSSGDARYRVAYSSTLNSYEDWAIGAHPVSGKTAIQIDSSNELTINTDHYVVGDPAIDEGAMPHTVTINGVIGGSGTLLITGGGKVVFNSVCSYSNWTKVAGEAVLKVGSKPGTSTLSVWSNGKLTLPDSGTVTLGSGIVVSDQSNLRFTINDNTDTNKLSVSGITYNEIDSEDKYVNVYVYDSGEQYMRGFTPYTLITVRGDPKLTTEDLVKFKLQDKPSWAHRLDVIDGNLVLWPSEPGLSLSVR